MTAAVAVARLRLRAIGRLLPSQLILDVVVPVAFALFAAHLAGPALYGKIPVAAAIMASASALFRGPAFQLSTERLDGTRDLLVASGVTRADYLAAHGLSALYASLFPMLAYGLAAAVLGVHPPADPAFWIGIVLLLAVAHGAGTLLGALFSGLGPLALTSNIVVLITAAVCPLLYPASRVPRIIAPLVGLLPPSLAVQLADRHPSGLVLSTGVSLLALLAWAIGLLALGHALFPWRRR